MGEFYSVAIANHYQQADTGTKMIHIGRNTKSRIVAKGISAGKAQNTYRGLVRMLPRAEGARNYTQCDSLLIGDQCGAHTVPYIENRNPGATHHRARSQHRQDQRRPAFLLPPARRAAGGSGIFNCERLLPRGDAATANGNSPWRRRS